MVSFSFDPSNLASLTAQQKAELAALKNRPDSEIDYTDIPELGESFWANAIRPAQENKKQITLRVDADVLDYYKHMGKRYQTQINAVLRAYMDATKSKNDSLTHVSK